MRDTSAFLEEYGGVGSYSLDPASLSAREQLRNRCRERCLYLITASEKTESRLREKLRRSGKYDAEIIDETMNFLKEYGYLDDRRYARQLIAYYEGTKSLREIEQKLCQRGVSRQDIREVIAAYRAEGDSEETELAALRHLIRKKCRRQEMPDEAARRKLFAALLRKGFSYELVERALRLELEQGQMPL